VRSGDDYEHDVQRDAQRDVAMFTEMKRSKQHKDSWSETSGSCVNDQIDQERSFAFSKE